MLPKTNRKAILLVLLLLPGLAADGPCDLIDLDPDGRVCTTEAVASVVLTIISDTGDQVPAATIYYTIDGALPTIGDCTGNCGEVVLAFEDTGRFDIEVAAPGFLMANRSVVVELDDAGCHPVTEELIVVLDRDRTVGVLQGAWSTSNFYGQSVLRFGSQGEIIGVILYDRTIGGDGNFYIAYNGHPIRGAPGQTINFDNAPDPTLIGGVFNFRATTMGIPIGFENAVPSADYNTLTGMLSGVPATYTRLLEIPDPLLDQ